MNRPYRERRKALIFDENTMEDRGIKRFNYFAWLTVKTSPLPSSLLLLLLSLLFTTIPVPIDVEDIFKRLNHLWFLFPLRYLVFQQLTPRGDIYIRNGRYRKLE